MGRSRFPARRCLRHFVRGYYLLTADAVFCPYRGIFTSIYQASVWHPYEIRVWCSRMGFAYGIRVWGCVWGCVWGSRMGFAYGVAYGVAYGIRVWDSRMGLRPDRGRRHGVPNLGSPTRRPRQRSMCGVPEGQMNPYSHSVAESLFGTYGAV